MVAAGLVAAKDGHFHGVEGLPSEAEIAKEVKALPANVGGKVIGEGTPIEINTNQTGYVVKLAIEHGKWNFLSLSDMFSVIDSTGKAFAGGVYIKEFTSIIGKHRLVMYSPDGKPICLAVQEFLAINKKYDLYGLNPLLEGDAPAEKEGDIDFYPWFRVRDIDDTHLDFRSFLVWNGNNYQPMMRIVPAKRQPGTPSSDLLPPRKGDNVVVDCEDASKVYAIMSKKSEARVAGWDVCVAPGADVMAITMLAAVMDDMVGWFA